MSKFINQFISNVLLFSVISQGTFEPIRKSDLDYIKYTDHAYTISKMRIGDFEFEDIMIHKTLFGFQFISFTEESSIIKYADKYFKSDFADDFYNTIYKEKGWQKRRYFDETDNYNIIIDISLEIKRYCLAIRFENKLKCVK